MKKEHLVHIVTQTIAQMLSLETTIVLRCVAEMLYGYCPFCHTEY